jgi:hypothetical protein
VSAPEASVHQPQDRRQAAAEARRAAIRDRVRADVAAWPPLTEWQRERLRELLDLSDGQGGAPRRGTPPGTTTRTTQPAPRSRPHAIAGRRRQR